MQYGSFPVVTPAKPYETDPRNLERWPLRNADAIQVGADNITTAAAWTAIDKIGDYVTGSQWNNTWVTVLNVASGRGTLYGGIGPKSNAASVQTWEVTVDGVVRTFTITTQYATRAAFGRITRAAGIYTTAGVEGGIIASTDLESRDAGSANAFVQYNTTHYLRLPSEIDRFIRFDSSLLVRAKNSAAANAGGARDDYCGLLWHLDT